MSSQAAARQTEPEATAVPTTRQECARLLGDMDWPIPTGAVFQAIEQHDWEKFCRAVAAVADGDKGEQSNYLRSIIAATTPDMLSQLKKLGHPIPPFLDLIRIGLQEPKFRNIVANATRGSADATADVRRLLSTKPAANSVPAQPAGRQEQKAETNSTPPRQQTRERAETGRSAERQPAPSQTDELPEAAKEREYVQHHVYAGNGALTFSAETTRDNEATIFIDGAKASASRTYDWKNKVRIQFSPKELPLLIGVCLGWITLFESSGRGESHTKSMSFENQKSKIYVILSDKGISVPVPVTAADIWPVVTMSLRQLIAANPYLTGAEALGLCRNICTIHEAGAEDRKKAKEKRQSSGGNRTAQ